MFLKQGITINCILPGFVPTNLAPPKIIERMPKQYITPMSTVMRAFDTFLGDRKMTGQTVELSGHELHFHTIPKYPDEISRWLHEESKYLWNEVYPGVPAKES